MLADTELAGLVLPLTVTEPVKLPETELVVVVVGVSEKELLALPVVDTVPLRDADQVAVAEMEAPGLPLLEPDGVSVTEPDSDGVTVIVLETLAPLDPDALVVGLTV